MFHIILKNFSQVPLRIDHTEVILPGFGCCVLSTPDILDADRLLGLVCSHVLRSVPFWIQESMEVRANEFGYELAHAVVGTFEVVILDTNATGISCMQTAQ